MNEVPEAEQPNGCRNDFLAFGIHKGIRSFSSAYLRTTVALPIRTCVRCVKVKCCSSWDSVNVIDGTLKESSQISN